MRSFLFILFLSLSFVLFAQVTISGSIVPKYIQGVNGTNNSRMPFAFYAQFSGMQPNSWYRYFTALDTFGSINTGGGNTWLLNKQSGTVRRNTNSTLNNVNCYDSVYTDAAGNYEGWFMVETTGNIRFTPGNKVYPFVLMNDGAGGIASVNRMRFLDDTMTVLDFGSVAGDSLQCSAIWDSTIEVPKSFVLLYDDTGGVGRPLACTIVEDDGLSLSAVNSFSSTYKAVADSINQHWCTYIPNANQKGMKRVEYRDWYTGSVLSYVTDTDGVWCSGVNTIDPQFGEAGVFLNSLIILEGIISAPDSAGLNLPITFSVTNSNALDFQWDFGDGSGSVSGQSLTHAYTANGWYYVTCIISGSGCSITLTDSILIDVSLSSLVINSEKTFNVFPTIFFEDIVIEPSAQEIKYEYSLKDVSGRTISFGKNIQGKISVAASEFASGIYILELKRTSSAGTECFKLIRQ